MKVALFKSTEYSWATPIPSEETLENCETYVRVSEYAEVDFPPLSNDIVIQQQLDALDRTEQQLRLKFQERLDTINNQRAELQSLTYIPAA